MDKDDQLILEAYHNSLIQEGSGFSTLSDYSDHINRQFSKLLKENGIEVIRKNS